MSSQCTPAQLVDLAKCLACGMSEKQLLAALVVLLCQSNNMTCTAPQLNALGSPFMQQMTHTQMLAAMVALLCNLGSSSSASQIVPYTGTDPNSDGVFPADRQSPAIAVKPFNTTYVWSVALQTWDV